MRKAVSILSGGQDSITCSYWGIDRFDEVEAITFDYGQKHSIEVECAKQFCRKEGIKHTIIDISFLGTLVDSALTSNGDVNKINAKGLPASFVPNRNQLFITLAHAYAQKIRATALIIGVCETDYSGYPDCRDKFINIIEIATNLGSDSDIEIHTPLMHLSKAETFEMAHRLGKLDAVIEMSHTCYNGTRDVLHDWGYGCGKCPACKLRSKGYTNFLAQKHWG